MDLDAYIQKALVQLYFTDLMWVQFKHSLILEHPFY